MKPQDAKFILRAHRADGRYKPGDPLFAEAMADAARDKDLQTWLVSEQALDDTLAQKLDGIQPPAGLRDAILIGARASRLSRHWWQNPLWFAAAAVLVVALATTSVLLRSTGVPGPASSLAEFGIDQLAFGTHDHERSVEALAFGEQLTASNEPLRGTLAVEAAEFARRGCEEFTFGSRSVYEVCFQREGVWYHLYVTTRDAGNPHDGGPEPTFIERHGLVAATWAHGSTIFAVATDAGVAALQRIL